MVRWRVSARWGWRRLGARYFVLYFAFDILSAYSIAAGDDCALLSLYQDMSVG